MKKDDPEVEEIETIEDLINILNRFPKEAKVIARDRTFSEMIKLRSVEEYTYHEQLYIMLNYGLAY